MVEERCMKAAVLFSGGKDSCLALHLAREKYDVEYLLSVIPDDKDALLFHTPDVKLVKKQAEMLEINLILQKTKFGERNELESLRKLLHKVRGKADIIVIGGIASSFQGKRFKKEIESFGFRVEVPLWDFSAEKLWGLLLKKKFRVVLTKIACEGLKKEHLGKAIDKKMFKELKKLNESYKFDLTAEGGDFETAVLGMPEFKKDIKIKFSLESEGKYRHFLNIKKIN